jgi:flagellar biosynthetic protein FliQ
LTIEAAVYLGQQTLFTVMLVAGPVLAVSLVVGVVVSLLQTVTQVQEVTLSFIPKTLAVFVCVMMLGGFMLEVAVRFGVEMFSAIQQDQP